jgi:hypothetical protein
MIQTKKRPTLLTVICIIGYLWIVFTFPGIFSPFIKRLGDWYPAIYGLIVAFSFISFVGVWHMKKWGVNLYIITFFAKQIFLYLIDDYEMGTIVGIFLSVFFIISFLVFYKRMNSNL